MYFSSCSSINVSHHERAARWTPAYSAVTFQFCCKHCHLVEHSELSPARSQERPCTVGGIDSWNLVEFPESMSARFMCSIGVVERLTGWRLILLLTTSQGTLNPTNGLVDPSHHRAVG